MDKLPHPAYDLLPPLKNYKSRARKKPVGAIITSRGCPFQCTFCNSSVFGKKFRSHSTEYVIKEIDILVNQYGIKQLDVLDDNFTLDIERTRKISDSIINMNYGLSINLQNGVHADRLTEDLVKRMKKAGVFKVGIGIESANKEILTSIRKSLDLKKVVQAIRWFRQNGIITVGFFILGFPTDTKQTMEQTIDFAIKANPGIANFMLLITLPRTEIYDFLKEKNLLIFPDKLFYGSGFYERCVYHKCLYVSQKELILIQRRAYSTFNFRISKMIETLFNIRSFSELKWTLEAGIPILKNIIIKR